MKRTDMTWTTLAVTICFGVGFMGFVKAQPVQPPVESLESVGAFMSSAVLSRMQWELAGAGASLADTLVVSAKTETDGLATSGTSFDAGKTDPRGGEPDGVASLGPAFGPPVPDAAAGAPAAQPETNGGQASAAGRDAAASGAEASETDGAPAAAGGTKAGDVAPVKEAASAVAARKVAFIYHSHNRESWLPELKGTGKDKPSEAFDAKVNISLLGERMKKRLEEDGVGAVHSSTDYNTAVPSFNYNYSYKYSKTTVKEALAVHKDLVYLFDLHRDSSRRKHTTVTIDGKAYARLYFVIGAGNPNWKENEAFAKRVHEKLESRFPGLSKGILTKSKKHGNGEYNQSLSPGSLLIEIGGVDNTLEESYRTIDALASVVAEMVKEAEKADAPLDGPEAESV